MVANIEIFTGNNKKWLKLIKYRNEKLFDIRITGFYSKSDAMYVNILYKCIKIYDSKSHSF